MPKRFSTRALRLEALAPLSSTIPAFRWIATSSWENRGEFGNPSHGCRQRSRCRIIFFSDAVFAIAITLLAVNLRVPSGGGGGSADELSKAIPGIFGFAISFAVIAFFWLGHHAMFRYITAVDRPLIALNLVFLGTIAFRRAGWPHPGSHLAVRDSRARRPDRPFR